MRQAFERAIAQHKDSVFSFAYYYLGDRQEAEDVTQDVLLKLWQKWSSLPSEAVGPWLNRVTRNASIDCLRKRKVHRRFVVEDSAEESGQTLLDRVPAKDGGPEAELESGDFVQRVRRAMLDLPEPYRSAMILREIRELSYRDIGESLELPTNTIKTHVHRGRRMLRELLDQSLEDPNVSTSH